MSTFKPENDAPIGADRHSPVAGKILLEWMQSESGQVHILWYSRSIESGEYIPHSLAMLRIDAALISTLHKSLQRLALEVNYH